MGVEFEGFERAAMQLFTKNDNKRQLRTQKSPATEVL